MNTPMGAFRAQLTIAIGLLLTSSMVGFAQTTQPAAAPATPSDRYDHVALRVAHRSDSAAPAASQPADDLNSTDSIDYQRVALALGIVIGLIFVTRWASKKLFPGAVMARTSGAMKVMSRLVISPKQQLLMVQVGRRIVVVGDSAGQMAAVSEITDPDEVASLVAQLTEDKSMQISKGFGSLFSRARTGFDSPEAQADAEDDAPTSIDSPSIEEPAISDARGELHGLMDKVRLLSSQFRRST